MDYEEYIKQVEADSIEEFNSQDRVHILVRVHAFVSKSKGRNRKRKKWEEIKLVAYRDNGFRTWSKFPFDRYATEVLGDIPEAETKFIEQVEKLAFTS